MEQMTTTVEQSGSAEPLLGELSAVDFAAMWGGEPTNWDTMADLVAHEDDFGNWEAELNHNAVELADDVNLTNDLNLEVMSSPVITYETINDDILAEVVAPIMPDSIAEHMVADMTQIVTTGEAVATDMIDGDETVIEDAVRLVAPAVESLGTDLQVMPEEVSVVVAELEREMTWPETVSMTASDLAMIEATENTLAMQAMTLLNQADTTWGMESNDVNYTADQYAPKSEEIITEPMADESIVPMPDLDNIISAEKTLDKPVSVEVAKVERQVITLERAKRMEFLLAELEQVHVAITAQPDMPDDESLAIVASKSHIAKYLPEAFDDIVTTARTASHDDYFESLQGQYGDMAKARIEEATVHEDEWRKQEPAMTGRPLEINIVGQTVSTVA